MKLIDLKYELVEKMEKLLSYFHVYTTNLYNLIIYS